MNVLSLKDANKQYGLSLFGRSNGLIRLADLPISKIAIGERPLPRDSSILEELKVSIAQVGQTTPVLVRQLDDATRRLIDGWHRLDAMSAIGRANCTALILNGLTDKDAEMLALVSNLHRRKLSALDDAIHTCRFLQYVKEKVPQGATPPGGNPSATRMAPAIIIQWGYLPRICRWASSDMQTPPGSAIPSRRAASFVRLNAHWLNESAMQLDYVWSEIERIRTQVHRQRGEIRQLQKAGIATSSAEALLVRMLNKIDELCAERDKLKKVSLGQPKAKS